MGLNCYKLLAMTALFIGMLVACHDDQGPESLDPTDTENPGSTDTADPTLSSEEQEQKRWAAIDYASNQSGLITADTLTIWLNGWAENRPAAITGDLVILQLGVGEDEHATLASHDNVRVYDVSDDIHVLNEPRNNGIFAAGHAPARGVRVDAFFRKYDIDPQADLVVFIAGELSDESLSLASMGWLALRYWGVASEHLAIVNGDVTDVHVELRTQETLEALYEGTVRVLVLPSTHFDTTLTLEDVRTWVQARPDDQILWDTRTNEEFQGESISKATRDGSCIESAPNCTALFAGRIAGAEHLPYTEFLDENARIRAPHELQALLTDRGVSRQKTHLVYDGDGARSAIVAFIFLGVIDYAARWYPNSFVEWSALNASHPEPKLRRLAEDNPWRTDTMGFSQGLELWADEKKGTHPIVINSKSDNTANVQREDEQYLLHPPALPVVNLNDPTCF